MKYQLPRKREEILEEINNVKWEARESYDRTAHAILLLAEIILEKEEYPTLDENPNQKT